MHRRTLNLPPTITRGRIITLSGVLLLITLICLFTPKTTIQSPTTGGYPYVKPATRPIRPPTPDPPSATPPAKKLIVKVQLEGEDLNWLWTLHPEWRNHVLSIDRQFALLHAGAQRVDKGRTADAYLRWIITHYSNLAETLVFVPPGLETQEQDTSGWRVPNQELVVDAIDGLSVEGVQKSGFVPLRCLSVSECDDAALSLRNPPDRYRTLGVDMAEAWVQMFGNTRMPEQLAGPGGGAFAVSKTQVLKRSVEEYTRYWKWLAKTEMDDDSAGALVERLWHVVFGKESVWCPAEEECRCEVFGRC